jgi:hypothetical protein
MRLVIEERHTGKPAREEALLATHAESTGVPVERMTWKPFVRNRIKPLAGDVVAGSVSFVRAALQTLGRTLPKPNPYPLPLHPWLHRKVWLGGTVGDVVGEYSKGPLFIKPAKRWKLFTGFVLDEPNPPQLYRVSRSEPIWCSEPVNFLSEWRVYVVRGEIAFMGLTDYGGQREFVPDMEAVRGAVGAYRNAPSAYAIDFGVLKTGETALIEVNDGFSVGAYDGIPPDRYFAMVATRWAELAA